MWNSCDRQTLLRSNQALEFGTDGNCASSEERLALISVDRIPLKMGEAIAMYLSPGVIRRSILVMLYRLELHGISREGC